MIGEHQRVVVACLNVFLLPVVHRYAVNGRFDQVGINAAEFERVEGDGKNACAYMPG
jgi:hypothetical protein